MEGSTSHSKTMMFEQFYGLRVPFEVVVHLPIPVKTKDNDSRLISKKETTKRKENKPLRICSNCYKLLDHNARNCPA
ncbi:nucleic acid binding / zinc ion binding protein [Perilla frutescens var. hirtella]|nr:nucleic acid binding / zinc ion binding protein [Perilla frutescens var. hirtella]KAH6807385.1 nucleic acid binding / zinc ion binding protein [Perilla frutescens var. frutescens]